MFNNFIVGLLLRVFVFEIKRIIMISKAISSLFLGFILISNSFSQELNLSNSWGFSATSPVALENIYLSNSVHINESGEVLNGAEAIRNFWLKQDISIVASKKLFETNAVYRDNIVYRIDSFKINDEYELVHLLVEQTSESGSRRKLEFISKKEFIDLDLSVIDQRRADWIEYCNSHDAEGLVQNLYTENAVYYNHRPVIIGHEALSQVYQYMNNPRYSLNLIPLHVEVVSESIVFEIGQCEGSYNGKYMLVWQKGDDGIWRILMDSNI